MRPATPRRERILVYGGAGTSKTRSWMTIADMYRKTNTPGTFYHVDTDEAYWANIEEFPELAEAGIIVTNFTPEWDDLVEVTTEYKAKAGPNDWVVGDLFDKGWEYVQEAFSNKVYGKSKAEYFLEKRMKMEESKKKNQPVNLEGFIDWPTVKAMHNDWVNDIMFRHKAHVYLATTQKPVNRGSGGMKGDDKDTVDTFGHLGSKPGGEKNIGPHSPNTVLRFARRGSDEWVMDTAKDRGAREDMMTVKNNNFALDYLLHPQRGGWLLQ